MIMDININDIKPNPENPRVIKDAKYKKLVKSIKDFPEMLNIRPIVVNSDMMVLGGNMRLKACIDAGMKTVPVYIADTLDEAKQREFMIKDNSSFGEWDWDILANEWETNSLNEWGIDIDIYDHETENSEIIEEDIKPYKMTHVLLSFHPSKFIEIQYLLDQILKIDGVQYEQSNN